MLRNCWSNHGKTRMCVRTATDCCAVEPALPLFAILSEAFLRTLLASLLQFTNADVPNTLRIDEKPHLRMRMLTDLPQRSGVH